MTGGEQEYLPNTIQRRQLSPHAASPLALRLPFFAQRSLNLDALYFPRGKSYSTNF
jgi:hypothetical protein